MAVRDLRCFDQTLCKSSLLRSLLPSSFRFLSTAKRSRNAAGAVRFGVNYSFGTESLSEEVLLAEHCKSLHGVYLCHIRTSDQEVPSRISHNDDMLLLVMVCDLGCDIAK